MIKPFHSRPFRAFFPVGLSALALALIVWAGLTGCKPVEIDAPPADTTSVTADSAVLRVSNQIQQDPDSITLFLYSGNTVDIINANSVKRLGAVAFGGTRLMKVPAGTWKLAYANRSGVLSPMVDNNDPAQEWLKSIFVKNADYSLILSTDGDKTEWKPTFKTVPAIQ